MFQFFGRPCSKLGNVATLITCDDLKWRAECSIKSVIPIIFNRLLNNCLKLLRKILYTYVIIIYVLYQYE